MTQTAPAGELTVLVTRDADHLSIALKGRLDARTLSNAWQQAVLPAAKDPPKSILVDAAGITYCDGAGLGLFAELRRIATDAKGDFHLQGLTPELSRLVNMSLLQDPSAAILYTRKKRSHITQIGYITWMILKDQRQLIAFIGELTIALLWSLAHPHRIRWRDLLRIAQKAGADALPVVGMLGFLVGMILAFQMAGPLRRYGAEALIPTIVSFAIIRELGPLITAVILAGRSGSAFAAEIGTMKVTEELAALKTLGLEPVRFLVIPRVLAAVIITPLLTAYNILLGLVGGGIVMLSLGYGREYYISTVQNAIKPNDYIGGIVKAFIFGLIVAAVGCLRGTQTQSGPGAVGDSTTRAVVAGIVLTIIADAILGVIYFYMGI